MKESRLAPICEPRRRRYSLALWVIGTASLAASGATMLAIAAARYETATGSPRPPAPSVVAVWLPAQPAQLPPTPPASSPALPAATPADAALGCPAIADDEPPIGVAVRQDELTTVDPADPAPSLTVIAAAHAPRLALRRDDGGVMVSDDDGATFHAAFAGHRVDEIRFDRDGVLYARSGVALGVRDDRERWRDVAIAGCSSETCRDRIATIGDRLVWIRDGRVATSGDRGKTWRPAPDDVTWSPDDGALFTWGGALYQAEHYSDMCGVDDSPTWRFDPSANRVVNDIFHGYGDPAEPELVADDDVATFWHWRQRCSDQRRGPCDTLDRVHSALFMAQKLRPVEGGRTLAVYERALVELCGTGARQVYRAFPFDHVDAVDSHGRPLVASVGTVFRWSQRDGWRRLLPASAKHAP